MTYESSITPTGGEVAHTTAAAAEASVAHVESQLTAQVDVTAAHKFFQPVATGLPTPTFTGAETAVAGKAAALAASSGAEAQVITAASKAIGSVVAGAGEAAAMGAHAIAGAAEVSPVIQLIMKLPGLGGVAQTFFEWLASLFVAPDFSNLFDPKMWAELGGSLQANLAKLASQGVSAEHFQVPLSMLPGNAPFLHQIGMQAGTQFSDMQSISHFSANGLTNQGGLSGLSMKDPMNVAGPLDLKKAQFEMGQSANPHSLQVDGKMSGPHMSGEHNPNFLAGTKRLFADQASQQNSLLSQSNVSAGNTVANNVPANASSMNISSNSFSPAQETSAAPANYNVSDGIISGPSVSSTNIGYQLSDASSASSAVDKASALSPSGAVGDTLGGNNLLASNDVPGGGFGGGYFKPAVPASTGDSSYFQSASRAPITELKAEPMSLLKKANPNIGKVPDKGVTDHIGHQSKGAMNANSAPAAPAPSPSHSQAPMDQISHRGHHAAAESAPKHVAHKVSADAHPKVHHAAKHVERVAQQPAAQDQAQQVSYEQQQVAQEVPQAGDQQLASNYHVQSGDNLWDIARKQLGDGTRWQEIYKLNTDVIGANPSLIHTGIDLKLPGADGTQITDASTGSYTVQPGDNLWDISKEKLGDGSRWGEIFDANKAIIGDNPRMIFGGQQLQMPGAPQLQISQAPVAPATPVAQVPQQVVAPQAQLSPVQQAAPVYQPEAQLSQAPQQSYLSGPGAAGAATLDPTLVPRQDAGPVSASLAPDLSFLSNPKTGR